MNDKEEFGYARKLVDEVFDELAIDSDQPKVTARLTRECRVNLERIMTESENSSRAYCACLSFSRDQESQWRSYADGGKGFSLGFDLPTILHTQQACVETRRPYLLCAPVRYRPKEQRAMVKRVFEAAIQRMQNVADSVSRSSEDLTALYRIILGDVIAVITVHLDFMTHPDYEREREMRIMRDANHRPPHAQGLRSQFLRRSVPHPHLRMSLIFESAQQCQRTENLLPLCD